MTKSLLVSIVMPVYNGERYLRSAIDSILNQTFKDFEFIIVNDGSTDRSPEIVTSYKDPRIKVFNKSNSGIVDSLNLGIKESKGKYIARMDADDISLPLRIESQVKFMEKNREIGLLGTTMQIIYEDGGLGYVVAPLTEDEDIRKAFLVTNMLVHGSAMMRRTILDQVGKYSKKAKHVEDYDLWIRFSRVTKISNLQDLLYQWRVNLSGLSHKNSAEQTRTEGEIRRNFWEETLEENNLPRSSVSYIMSRKNFYLERDDPYKKLRIAAYIDITTKYARNLALLDRKIDAFSEFIGAILLRPHRIRTYFYISSLVLGETKANYLERKVRDLLAILRTGRAKTRA